MTSTVYIAKNVYGGDGLGRLGDGRVVFVPGAWAGEQVRAELVEEKRRFVRARLVEVVEASPERRPETGPTVPGMVYAGLSYRGECAAKERQLREFFDRARIPVRDFRSPPLPAAAAEPPLHYRNKVVYHFARQDGRWAIGYRTEPTHRIVEVEHDPLAVPAINAKLPEIRRAALALLTTGPETVRRDTARKGGVTVRWTAKSGVSWWVGEAPRGLTLRETTCGRDFEVPADGFYQVNPQVGGELAEAVVAAYRQGADVAPEVLDLYCGVGVLGLCCAPPQLVGVESGRQAVVCAQRNAAGRRPAGPTASPGASRFFVAQVGRDLRRLAVGPQTTVIVDPPRGGLEPNVPAWLAASPAPRLLYVSCDPATLVRDLKPLCRAYDVASVRWFDMFPRTARFETLVVLERRRG
ncbi:MAG: class I SAM-dependent RNA methyltransferase [Kiritimatiellia bacterium]